MSTTEKLDNKIKEFWPKNGPVTQEIEKYVKKYSKEKIVIKCGGRVLLDPEPFNNFISESYRVLKKDGILTIAMPVVKKKSNIRNLGILSLTWSSEHYSEHFVINEITKKFKLIKKIEIGPNVFEPLASYYFKNRKRLQNKILTHYTSFVENMLFKSLLKMKKSSDKGVIDYLIIKCVKCD